MTSSNKESEININYKSISCENIPELFLDKIVAKNHFSKYGKINKFILRPRRLQCTVDFEQEEDAKSALINGGVFNGHEFCIKYTESGVPQVRNTEEWVDADIQSELDAMGSVSQKPYRNVGLNPPPIFTGKSQQSIMRLPKPILKNKSSLNSILVAATESVSNETRSLEPNVPLKQELENIMRKQALSPAEKYNALEARDKYIRLTMSKTVDIRNIVSMNGTCPDMCPEKERLLRETRDQVSIFELEKDGGSMNHKIAIKEYARSSADQESPLSHELRPEATLKMTMAYLLHRIMDLCDDDSFSIGDWFHFVWDRTRSIRKDITQQELCSVDVVELIEQCARFHIHCAARLIAEDPSVFDQKINTENLTKCLQSLKYMYHDLRIKNTKCPNESEFRAYIVLLNLNDANFLWEVKQLPEAIRKSTQIKEAIDFYLAVENNNFVKFFKMIRKTTYMNSCILMRYFNQVRSSAVRTIIKAYTSTRQNMIQIPLSYLTDILAFESVDDAVIFFDHYKIECDYDKVTLEKNWNYIPDIPPQLDRCLEIVESKRLVCVGESICGKHLPSESIFANHEPHNSFDGYGYLKQNAWTAGDQNGKKIVSDSKSLSASDNVFKVPINSPPISPKQHQNQQIKSLFGLTQKKNQNLFLEESEKKSSNSGQESVFGSIKSSVATSVPIFVAQTSAQSVDDTSSAAMYNSSTLKSNEPNIFSQPSIENVKSSIFPKRTEPVPLIFGNNTALKKTSMYGKQTHKFSSLFNESDEKFAENFQSEQNESHVASNSNIFLPALASSNLKPVTPNIEFLNKITNKPEGNYYENMNSVMKSYFVQNLESNTSNNITADKKSDFQNKEINSNIASKKNRKRKSENDEYLIQVQTISEEENISMNPIFQPEKLFKIITQNEKENNVTNIHKKEEKNFKKEEEKRNLAFKQERIEANSENILTNIMQEVQENLILSIIEDIFSHLKKTKFIELTARKILESLLNETIEKNLKEISIFELKHFLKNQILVRKYFIKWRNSTRKSMERKFLIQGAQNWAMPENIEIVAKGMAHPAERLNLDMIYRYRLGVPKIFDLSAISTIKKINVISILSQELEKDNINNKIYGRMKSRKYFKLVISLPNDTEELKGFGSHFNSYLNDSIERAKSSDPNKAFMCEVHSNMAVCIQVICGKSDLKTIRKCDHLNGLIFVFTLENLSYTRKRLLHIFKNFKMNAGIPISLLLYKNYSANCNYEIEDILALEELHHLEKISKFKVFEFDDYNIGRALIESVKYLAENRTRNDDLEMQNFVSFLQATIANEIWKRFCDSWLINPPFRVYCNRPENVVSLYNTAVNKLIDLFKEDLTKYPELPKELLEFVPHLPADIPKEVEYFPENWSEDKRNIKFVTFLQKLKLKDIENEWPTDIQKLEMTILNYSKECLSISKPSIDSAGYSSIKVLLEKLNNVELINVNIEDRLKQLSWLEIIKPIALELLSQAWKILQNLIPKEVIYRKDKYHEFIKLPWWLKDLQSKQLKFNLENENLSKHEKYIAKSTSHSKEDNEDDIDLILNKGYQLIEKARENIDKYHSYINSSKEISKNLDFSLYKLESNKLLSFPHLKEVSVKNEEHRKKLKTYGNFGSDEVQETIDNALSIIKKFELKMDSRGKNS